MLDPWDPEGRVPRSLGYYFQNLKDGHSPYPSEMSFICLRHEERVDPKVRG